MQYTNEALLNAWLRLSTSIVNSRIVPDMTYNESLVCNILYNHSLQQAAPLTATHLCRMTGMLKSQMNRTLNALEERGLIIRERSREDKRQVFVFMHPENNSAYIEQHDKILRAVDALVERIGTDRAQQALELFTIVADNADIIMSAGRKE